MLFFFFFFQAEDGIRDFCLSRGLGDVYKRQVLARGEVRIIGATTLSEYKEFIQEDEALARRFRTVQVDEPTIEQTRTILYNLRPRLERNYSVRIKDEAIETALEMSPRYMRLSLIHISEPTRQAEISY